MNYLSHFYVYQTGSNPLYSLGLVFPDLSRGFVKGAGKGPMDSYGTLSDLALGCQKHYEADKLFHGSSFFDWGTQVCTDLLKAAAFESAVERRWFIGHVLFELLVDRILVRHQARVAEEFYNELYQVNVKDLQAFISLHDHQQTDRFLRFFEHFRRAAYIRNYPDNNLFAFSLSRVILKAGLPELTLADKIVLQECVWKLEEGEFRNAQGILFELKEVFK